VIQRPQRFGEDQFWVVHTGESYLRANLEWVELGASTESLWWGPAGRYPLLLSNTAGGFPHLSLATPRPLDVRIGTLESQIFWGRLRESAYFDSDVDNDLTLLSGFTVSFRPWLLEGLHLGLAALAAQAWEDRDPLAIFRRGSLEEGAAGNGLAALFFRWIAPESAFEVYGEYGRNDFFWNLDDLLVEPEYSAAYMLGLRKATPFRGGWLQVAGEVTKLHFSVSTFLRSPASWYTHNQSRGGHTHRGQLLGAYVGPGSEAQLLGIDWYRGGQRTGLTLERVRWNEDAYARRFESQYGFHGHDVELSIGLRHALRLRDFVLDIGGAAAFRRNRDFIGLDGVNWDLPWDRGFRVDSSVAWTSPWPSLARGPLQSGP
jgi:hypothetical protein